MMVMVICFQSARTPLLVRKKNVKWFTPNTEAFEKLVDLLSNKRLLSDVKKLRPLHQTSSVEAFNSLVIHFALKSLIFSYRGMYCRIILAAMHYNENAQRKQAVNKSGEPVYSLHFPRFKKGGFTVRPVRSTATYGYIIKLMDVLMTKTMQDPTYVWQLWDEVMVEEPSSLCSTFIRPTLAEAVSQQTTQFTKK